MCGEGYGEPLKKLKIKDIKKNNKNKRCRELEAVYVAPNLVCFNFVLHAISEKFITSFLYSFSHQLTQQILNVNHMLEPVTDILNCEVSLFILKGLVSESYIL